MANKIKKLSYGEIAGFCDRMATILDAGITSFEGVGALLETEEDEESRQILMIIFDSLEEGHSFTSSIEKTGVFPAYVTQMIALGEHTGNLEEVLRSLAVYCSREEDIHAGIRQAVIYPIVMIVMMLIVMGVLVGGVLPIFNNIYSELGTGLTGMGLTVMKYSEWISTHYIPIMAVIILVLVAVIVYLASPNGREKINGSKLAMDIAAGRFASCMALALHSGLDSDQGMELAADLVENAKMTERINECRKNVERGDRIERAILDSGIFTGIYNSMILIGAKTGSMDEMMDKIAVAYDKESMEKINRWIGRLEPTLVIILSVIVGIILLAFLLPLLGIMSTIG